MRDPLRDLVKELDSLQPGEAHFIPTLRAALLLPGVLALATNTRKRFAYRETVVDGRYGVLFTRRTGRTGLVNEDLRPS